METQKGSITVFMALLLGLLTALVCSSVESVRMAASRTQILCGMDVGLYSLFAGYDRELLEKYDVFFLDGGYGGESLNQARVYDTFRNYMEPVLEENYQKLAWESGGITGYTLATDMQGELFYQQAVEYTKKTLGVSGLQLLLEKTGRAEQKSQNARDLWESAQERESLGQYDEEMGQAAQKSQEAKQKEEEAREEQEKNGEFAGDSADHTAAPKVENPIPVIREIRRRGILELVLPEGRGISRNTIQPASMVSRRSLEQGMGQLTQAEGKGFEEHLLFDEYILKKCGSYRNPSVNGLAYGTEYILHGKSADEENLKAAAGELLLIREGINLGYLLTDAEKMAQAQALALGICSAFLIPPAAGIVKMVLVLCWSFAESVLDVRSLLAGERVPLVKNAQTWQLSLGNLASFLARRDTDRKTVSDGMRYEDYLRVLLLTRDSDTACYRCMDMIEHQLRCAGRNHFSMDCCVGAVQMCVDVSSNGRKTYTVTREFSYV